MPLLDVFDRPIADWDIVMKGLLDKIVGSLALICLAPVMLLVALAIKLDSNGPVFFRQRRHGFNNELIEVYKFRSLYAEHDRRDTATKQVNENDPRVTRVGRFIRKTSLDELPQLFNVASPATCRWSGRGRTPSTPRPPSISTTRRWTAISRAIG